MVAPRLREVRRPKGSPARRRSLTAASQPITDAQAQRKSPVGGGGRNNWQVEAWELFEEIGELSYYVSWRANSCSRTQLIASEVDPETGLPTGGLSQDENGNISAEAQRVMEYVRAVADGPLGQAALIKRSVECLTVPGEVWVAMLVRSETDKVTGQAVAQEKWYAITREEWRRKTGDDIEIDLPDGSKHNFNPAVDSLIRVWFPRPRKATEATSPVRACLESLREIKRTSEKIRNAAKSRVMNNGVLFLPAEMSLPAAQAPIPEGQAEIPGAPVPVVQGVPAADQLSTLLYQASVASMEDHDNQTAYIPLLATVPGEHLAKVQHIKFGNEITEVEIKTRADAIARLAMGLDVSPERLLGMSKGNHWSAWQIGDEDVQLHIKPVMDLWCQAVYNDILVPQLRKDGIDPGKYMLWYDASGLTADPDLTDEATQAKDRGTLRNEPYLRAMGLPEDGGYDLTTLEGAQEWAREAITANPELLTEPAFQMLLGGELEQIEWPAPVAPPAIGDGKAQPGEGQDDGEQEPDTEDEAEDTAQAAALVPSSRAELILAERLLATRALDLAGKRRVHVRDTDLQARLRGRAPHEYHRVMGPVNEADIPKLIAGWDSGLEDEALNMLGVDTGQLREHVLQVIRTELTRPVIDAEVVSA